MGCDIHGNIEYKISQDYWVTAIPHNIPRDYLLFGLMANVRYSGQALYEPRGLPDDVSWETEDCYSLFINDDKNDVHEGYCSVAQAESWLKSGVSHYRPDGRVSNPDWHTPSWLTYEEFAKIYQRYVELNRDYLHLKGLVAYMQVFHEAGTEIRIVFWFDN